MKDKRKRPAKEDEVLSITNVRIEYHRNGSSGWPFYVVLFDWIDFQNTMRHMVASVFDVTFSSGLTRDDCVISVLDVERLGRSAFRGDDFADALWAAIDAEQE